MWSQADLDLSLTESDLSLTKCNYQSKSWSDWHINRLTKTSTKSHPDGPTCVEERERAQFPRLHDVVHSLLSADKLLLLRNGQLQSIQSRWDWFQSNRSKSHWFRIYGFLHYLINLSIKIINIWFLGFSDLSDGKSLKTLKKWVYGFAWCS